MSEFDLNACLLPLGKATIAPSVCSLGASFATEFMLCQPLSTWQSALGCSPLAFHDYQLGMGPICSELHRLLLLHLEMVPYHEWLQWQQIWRMLLQWPDTSLWDISSQQKYAMFCLPFHRGLQSASIVDCRRCRTELLAQATALSAFGSVWQKVCQVGPARREWSARQESWEFRPRIHCAKCTIVLLPWPGLAGALTLWLLRWGRSKARASGLLASNWCLSHTGRLPLPCARACTKDEL